jgi:hypothetical protein
VKTFEQLTKDQKLKAQMSIEECMLSSIIDGLLELEDVKMQSRVDLLIEQSPIVEAARKKVQILMADGLRKRAREVAEESDFDDNGKMVVQELTDEDIDMFI